MFRSIEEFLAEWSHEAAATKRMFGALTDASLNRRVTPRNRSIGQLASHIITSPHEMLARAGLAFEAPLDYDHVPSTAAEITEAYQAMERSLAEAIRAQWTDESLTRLSNMYGEEWANGFTLRVMIQHEVHHRAQLTVLARQAGLRVPGMYGPVLEEWAEMGMEPPAV